MLNNKKAARALFKHFDKDKSGAIDKDELQTMLKELNVGSTHGDAMKTLMMADADGSGVLEYNEFHKLVYGCPCPEEEELNRQAEERKARIAKEEKTSAGQEKKKETYSI